jgi:UDP-glucose 4-epimerase
LCRAVAGKSFIWHLGGNTDIPAGLRDTSLDLDNGLIATQNVLEAMRLAGVRKMAFPSSGAIYGEKTQGMRSETHGPTLPISLYGAGKLACEGFISAYAHLFGIQAWIFRFGNVIGGRISHGAILDFIRKLRANPKELEILGDGTQTKSYLLTEECIEGMQHVICSTPLREGEGFCDVFNLGAPDETPILELEKIVIEEMGLDSVEIKIKGGERGWPGDQAKIALDNSKIRSLGWRPKHTSNEAVRIAVKRMLEQEGVRATR